jgi:lipopolysaccharide transport system permease protein
VSSESGTDNVNIMGTVAAPESSRPAERVLVLEPGRTERNYWWDIWHYRELFAILAWRDIAVRYKQTVIGIAWAVHSSVPHHDRVHGDLRASRSCPSDGAAPYPVMVFAGMLPWFLFSTILNDASQSLVNNTSADRQGLFPAPDRALGELGRLAGRLRDLLR